MKIGIFSDVHGCLEPLEKALALFDTLQVDQIICCGDLVDGDARDDDVVALVKARAFPTVLGNHDAWLKNEAGYGLVPHKSETIKFISALPLTLNFEWEGKRVYLAHATPSNNHTYVFPTSSPDKLRQVAQAAKSDIVILGHTHIPMKIFFEGVWLLNPGSLFYNRTDNSRTCAVLTLPDITYEVWDVDSRRKVQYETG